MSNVWMNVTAAAAALSLAITAGVARAQDRGGARQEEGSQFVSRDEKGDIKRVDDAAGFGAAGQLTISTDAALSFERRTQSNVKGAVTTLSVLPAADYFVIDNLSVGGFIGVRYQRAGDVKSTSFMVGPRVGYNINFSRMLSLWPKVGFSYSRNKAKSSVDGDDVGLDFGTLTGTRRNNALALNVFVPIMLHPAPHFFAGFGPFLDTDLNGNNRVTIWGLRLTVGGWL